MLRVENLWKSYGTLQVLKGISFEVKEGNTMVIFGPSGSGKSTLLRCINMLNPPDKGHVFLRDVDLTKVKKHINYYRSKIGIIFQHFNLFNHLTALDNVSLGLKAVKKMSKAETEKRALEALTKVKMEKWVASYPSQLSGGQKQRVGIARAIALEPTIILFDEPTSALDPELIGEVLQVMLNLAKEKTTMICVTHELGFARAVASEMIFIDEGKIVEKGTPKHFFTKPSKERTRKFLNKISELYGHQQTEKS
ncbi:MAG: amino acid ABC transporter ATP-binding protein [Candidatus Bathyarchaeota archaeon]|nr:amino acid ABC transporter ATP-binding protein [Candidatus Bathyarchaeota archaeon]MDH5494161.1 amino acid ABC transporter ATP-binding protein [Candidatus Bathyarchaeota archaeon]